MPPGHASDPQEKDAVMTPLNALMRRQLTAINQQFIHVLALQAWKDEEIMEPIRVFDLIDVHTSMSILDHLARAGQPILLPAQEIAPGHDRVSILRAEQAMEESINALVAASGGLPDHDVELVRAVAAPRPSYQAWLSDRLAEEESVPLAQEPMEPALAAYCAHLLALTEQAMVHAFVQFHAGENAAADRAWSLSGRAMMDMMALVHHLARQGRSPQPRSFPAVKVKAASAPAEEADRALAGLVAAAGLSAAEESSDERLARIIAKAVRTYQAVTTWQEGQAFPPDRFNPKAFASFAASREEALAGY
ncbi:MAG: hypothetical protein AAFY02_09535 [Pseudomonadota bacterium]